MTKTLRKRLIIDRDFGIITAIKTRTIIVRLTMLQATSDIQLQQENARLLALLEEKEKTLKHQESTIELLCHQLYLFKHVRFGRKTEKGDVAAQLEMQFDEAIPVVVGKTNESSSEDTETITYTRNKKGKGRKALPKSLPYIEQVHDLTEAEKQCACGCTMTHIGDVVSEQLDVVPQMTFRVVHIRKKYACKGCEENIKSAKLPKQPIPQSIASPGMLAAVINSKFHYHMPLYRQEAMFAQAGVPITRGTLSDWVIKAADLLAPLIPLMEADIHDYDIAFVDETRVQVLKEKGRAATQQSFMWLFIGGSPEKRAFVYQYHPTRSHQIPLLFFQDFKGYVHADCYDAYVKMDKLPHIQHVACLAHARRYFVDATKVSKKKGLAHQVIELMAKLYHLESQLKEQQANSDFIYEQRQKIATPLFAEIKALVENNLPKVLPKSPLGQAAHYLLNHWHALMRYLDDGRLEIDNNRSERAIKPFVIGRKNWLFHGNDIGAKAGGILFSLIETCKHHHIDPFSWLKYVLTHIRDAHTIEQLEPLLPYNINPKLLADLRSIPNLIFYDKSAAN